MIFTIWHHNYYHFQFVKWNLLLNHQIKNVMSPSFHLIANAFPAAVVLTGAFILLIGFLIHSHQMQKTALITMVIAALFSIFVVLAGYSAKEQIRKSNPEKIASINVHEEKAQSAFVMMEILGILAIVTVYQLNKHNSVSSSLIMLCMILSFVVGYAMIVSIQSGISLNHQIVQLNE
jgi:uncharacterized membrane protein